MLDDECGVTLAFPIICAPPCGEGIKIEARSVSYAPETKEVQCMLAGRSRSPSTQEARRLWVSERGGGERSMSSSRPGCGQKKDGSWRAPTSAMHLCSEKRRVGEERASNWNLRVSAPSNYEESWVHSRSI